MTPTLLDQARELLPELKADGDEWRQLWERRMSEYQPIHDKWYANWMRFETLISILTAFVEGRDATLSKLKQAIDECKDDTWECPQCGHSEPWWTESNAHYSSAYPADPALKTQSPTEEKP